METKGGSVLASKQKIEPGLGQLCNGKILSALAWFIFVVIGYACFVIPGIILHICCIVNATK